MEWISKNWVWVLFFVAFMVMHMFGDAGVRSQQRTLSPEMTQEVR